LATFTATGVPGGDEAVGLELAEGVLGIGHREPPGRQTPLLSGRHGRAHAERLARRRVSGMVEGGSVGRDP